MLSAKKSIQRKRSPQSKDRERRLYPRLDAVLDELQLILAPDGAGLLVYRDVGEIAPFLV